MCNKIKAAIFDMDGTLIDSMWVWEQIDVEYLKRFSIEIPKDLRRDIEHLNFIETAKYFKNRFNIPDSIDDIMNDWNEMAYKHYLNDVELKDGVKVYLKFLKSKNIKIGLATSNCTFLIDTVLKRLCIYDFFDSITTTDETGKCKDFPDVYLLAAKKLGADPSECVVFEDILAAVLSAKKAGMKVIAVHDKYSITEIERLKKEADKFILSFEELTA
ncbi:MULTISPECIES: HAD family hydrolase [Clostridium]|uniref:HAD family hydrolase n=1 Tax=Clostridium TaxID=1485 RepID=UPI00069F4A30|nr:MULTISPECIES: HAD family phosphatase [Clostridium]KOF56190.1 HAD family hydrolase [Clostridium sp. DMHC 10]MCD2347853.1 HAD family phosphatase [Clostridium guangxiense]